MEKILILIIIILTPVSLFSTEFGVASWYGEKFHGRKTSSGEIFDMHKLTCAHKSIPFGTVLLVTNLDNEKCVLVKVNDRGPFVRGRIIDLSKAAAIEIGLLKTGIAQVKIEIIGKTGGIKSFSKVSLQVGSFREEANAKKMKEKLESAGLGCSLEVTGSDIVRVIVPDIAPSQLSWALKELERIGISSPIIVKR